MQSMDWLQGSPSWHFLFILVLFPNLLNAFEALRDSAKSLMVRASTLTTLNLFEVVAESMLKVWQRRGNMLLSWSRQPINVRSFLCIDFLIHICNMILWKLRMIHDYRHDYDSMHIRWTCMIVFVHLHFRHTGQTDISPTMFNYASLWISNGVESVRFKSKVVRRFWTALPRPSRVTSLCSSCWNQNWFVFLSWARRLSKEEQLARRTWTNTAHATWLSNNGSLQRLDVPVRRVYTYIIYHNI